MGRVIRDSDSYTSQEFGSIGCTKEYKLMVKMLVCLA